jgi:hypothetical protein
MPIVQAGPPRAAGAHDQADREARDYALRLGSSGRGAVNVLIRTRYIFLVNAQAGRSSLGKPSCEVPSVQPRVLSGGVSSKRSRANFFAFDIVQSSKVILSTAQPL